MDEYSLRQLDVVADVYSRTYTVAYGDHHAIVVVLLYTPGACDGPFVGLFRDHLCYFDVDGAECFATASENPVVGPLKLPTIYADESSCSVRPLGDETPSPTSDIVSSDADTVNFTDALLQHGRFERATRNSRGADASASTGASAAAATCAVALAAPTPAPAPKRLAAAAAALLRGRVIEPEPELNFY